VRQQRGRTIRRRTRRRPALRFLGRLRRSADRGVISRIRLGTAGRSPRRRRWALAVVLLGVALVPYPTLGAVGAPPAPGCRLGCRAGSVPGMVRWTAPLPGSWDVVAGLTGTTPASGLAYISVGDGVAAVGTGLTVTAYSASTGALRWHLTLTGFPAGAAIVSVRTWPGEVTAGVSYPAAAASRPSRTSTPSHGPGRTEVVISDAAGRAAGRYPAVAFGGAVAGSAQYTVIVGPAAVTSYDNATGRIRWQRPTSQVAQAWRTDGDFLYMTASPGGVVGSAPVTELRRIDMATGTELTVSPLESLSFRGTLSAAFGGVVLFTSAAGVTAYDGTSGDKLWGIGGAVPESTDPRQHRIYLTRGSNLIGVNPQTGRITATASGSAVDGSAGVYVVRGGVALGLDQGANGDAWGYNLAAQRVTLASAGLPWPHYFVDLSDVGGSADPASRTVVIAACTRLAPSSLTQPSPAASLTPGSASASAPASPGTSSPGPGSGSQAPDISPSAAVSAGQACLHPELVALNL
jgi:outer membrane protein assembly factor BamB